MQAKLAGPIDLAGFRGEAVQLLAQQVRPEDVTWSAPPTSDDQYAAPVAAAASRPRNVARAAAAIVPSSFLRLSEFVVLHRDPCRFALLYRLLWRLVHEPGLRADPLDADMQQAQHMAHAVRRELQKMKASLHFRALAPDAAGIALQVAWYEPSHHVVEAAAPWFARRVASPHWAILTPERSVRCDAGQLRYGPGLPVSQAPRESAPDAVWHGCLESLFPPA
jgi:probable DNA metabolism protein